MKKSLVITLALVFVLGIVSTAFAAANPFVDVPAKHWAYESVSKLAKAGIVDGYGDGTFRGDKNMTRYEMAQIVAKAMANSDKADAALKAEIAKLQVEFASELNNLGVRVAKLEKNASSIKITGEARHRYEWTDSSDYNVNAHQTKTRLRLKMEAAVNDDWTMKGRLATEDFIGTSNAPKVDQLYFVGNIGDIKATIGRQPLTLGKGLLMDTSSNWEGVRFDGGKDVKFAVGAVKRTNTVDIIDVPENYVFGQISYAPTKDFSLVGSYFADEDSVAYKAYTLGFGYTGIKDITLVGEYGQNDSDVANFLYDSAAKGWYVQAKYKGAVASKAGSYGVWAGYRNAEAGFDPLNYTTLYMTDFVKTFIPNIIGPASFVKGMELGFDYTLAKNIVMNARYLDLDSQDFGLKGPGQFIAEVNYFF